MMYKNILINALVNLGDVILTTSAAALIKKHFPTSKITIMVKRITAEAVINNPIIDDVIVFDYKAKENSMKKMIAMINEIKSRNFDLSISLDRKLRPAIMTFLAGIPKRVGATKIFDDKPSKVTWLYTDVVKINHDLNKTLQAQTYQTIVCKFFNIEGIAQPVFARITNDNKLNVDKLFKRLPNTEIKVALCVKGTFPLKTWPKEYFAEVLKNLSSQYNIAFYIIGAPNDKDYADEVIREVNFPVENFCGETSIVDLAEIFIRTNLFLTVDTGATHIAATTGVKMVTIYGCTSPDRWNPINDNAIVLTSRESCCPCTVKVEQCPTYPKPKCLFNVTPAQVIAACKKILDNDPNLK